MAFVIDTVTDLDAAWADVEALSLGIIEYHRPWDARPLRDDWALQMRDYLALGPDRLLLIARDEAGDAAGFVTGRMNRGPGIFDGVTAFIDNMYVDTTARAQGAGTALLHAFEEWAGREGATEVHLHVNAGNDLGQRFWKRSGFEIVEYVMKRPLAGAS